jgi:hypothetical protein
MSLELEQRLREAMPQYLRGLISSDDLEGDLIEAADALSTERARNEALVKALEWYADMANWETPFHPSGYGSLASNVTNDLGKRARAALSLKQEGVAK